MPHFRMAVVSMASALALAACSSSDSDGGLTTPDVPAATANSGGDDSALITAVKNDAAASQFAARNDDPFDGRVYDHFVAIAEAPDTAADPADLSGSAGYTGSLEVGEENDRILGEILMNVDFANGDVDGTLDNLRDLDDNDQPGDLDVSFDLTGNVTDSRLTATFEDQFDNGEGGGAASGRLEGVFVGDGSEVLGEARIDSVFPDGEERLDGTFHATEQTP